MLQHWVCLLNTQTRTEIHHDDEGIHGNFQCVCISKSKKLKISNLSFSIYFFVWIQSRQLTCVCMLRCTNVDCCTNISINGCCEWKLWCFTFLWCFFRKIIHSTFIMICDMLEWSFCKSIALSLSMCIKFMRCRISHLSLFAFASLLIRRQKQDQT